MTNPLGSSPGKQPPRVFLDSASGDLLHPAAEEQLVRSLPFGYADSRRLFAEGRQARMLLDNARAAIAEALAVRPDEVVLTGSGTTAVHLGLGGLLQYADQLVTSAGAHSSVLEVGRHAALSGATVTLLPLERSGRTRRSDVAPHAVLAMHLGNHEVGTLEDPAWWAAHPGPVFVNACATGARLPLPARWDAVALSAHKWGGPPGVGVLLLRRGARWRSPWPSDDRADDRTRGFENIPAALAAAAALQATVARREQDDAHQRSLTDRLRTAVAHLPDIDLHGDPDRRMPHVVAFSCLFVNGEALVQALDRRGFAVSSGSACTTSSLEPSHVLVAMGALTHGNIRVSVTARTTVADIDGFVTALRECLIELREVG